MSANEDQSEMDDTVRLSEMLLNIVDILEILLQALSVNPFRTPDEMPVQEGKLATLNHFSQKSASSSL
jgi:hypothetical protein